MLRYALRPPLRSDILDRHDQNLRRSLYAQ
jgi:hypothetical protein